MERNILTTRTITELFFIVIVSDVLSIWLVSFLIARIILLYCSASKAV